MVGAVAQHDVVDVRPFKRSPEALMQRPDPRLRVIDARDVREVAVVAEELERQDRAPVRRDPIERDPDVVELVAEPAREQEALDPEARQNLRELTRMAEAVREVAGRRGPSAEPLADGAADQEVTNERLGADQKLIGQYIAWTDLDPAGGDQCPQPRFVLGADSDVVLQHDRLSVERERCERRIAFERVEHLVDHASEHQPEVLERAVPLAIPVCMRHDEIALHVLGHPGR